MSEQGNRRASRVSSSLTNILCCLDPAIARKTLLDVSIILY